MDGRRPIPEILSGNPNGHSYSIEFSVFFFSVPRCLCGSLFFFRKQGDFVLPFD
jgi:hypothetical protein